LQEEEVAIYKKCQGARNELKELDDKLAALEKEENCERYVLWGVMVHQGNSATFGHYKLCLLLSDEWYEFNDKHVSKINKAAID